MTGQLADFLASHSERVAELGEHLSSGAVNARSGTSRPKTSEPTPARAARQNVERYGWANGYGRAGLARPQRLDRQVRRGAHGTGQSDLVSRAVSLPVSSAEARPA